MVGARCCFVECVFRVLTGLEFLAGVHCGACVSLVDVEPIADDHLKRKHQYNLLTSVSDCFLVCHMSQIVMRCFGLA